MAVRRPSSHRLILPRDPLTIGLLIAFVIIGVITAWVAYGYVRSFVSTWNLTNLPGDPLQGATNSSPGTISTTSNGTSLAVMPTSALQLNNGPTPQPWDGASRVNILLLGLDYDWAVGGSAAQRSDTMILLTVDPISKTAGMLSIPRDLWVNIPGFDYGKINTAYFLGQSFNLPGGGPGLAVKTVENLLGVPINYYAQIDFAAFVNFIDDIQGVKLTIAEEMVVGLTGKDQKVTLEPGTYTLDGATTLGYARDRYTGIGDFDRSSRQMQVIMAVRNRILEFNMLPNLIAKSPAIYKDLSSGIHTNLNLQQIIELALLASQIPKENIKQAVIGTDQVQFATSPDGTQSILVPVPDEIRLLRDEIFTTGGPVSPAAIATDPTQLMLAENATVSVQNGTSTTGLADKTVTYLKSQGMSADVGPNADLTTYTILIDYSGRPYTLAYLAKLMNVPSSHIFSRYDPNSTIDITIQLGSDWAKKNPM